MASPAPNAPWTAVATATSGRSLRRDLNVLQVRWEAVTRRSELGVQRVVERRGIPVVNPADDLAVGEVDRRENPQLAAEELRRVGHVDEGARLVGETPVAYERAGGDQFGMYCSKTAFRAS